MTTVDHVLDYLRVCVDLRNGSLPDGWRYLGPDDFVLAHGRAYDFAPLPDDVERGAMKQCFYNAFMLSVERSDLTYVEGYAVSVIPMAHAWCVDAAGTVVDPTWEDGRAYFGVPFKQSYVSKVAIRSGVSGVFWENEMMINVPLMTGEDAIEDVLVDYEEDKRC